MDSIGLAVSIIARLTPIKSKSIRQEYTRAATPATIGAAMEVPDIKAYPPGIAPKI